MTKIDIDLPPEVFSARRLSPDDFVPDVRCFIGFLLQESLESVRLNDIDLRTVRIMNLIRCQTLVEVSCPTSKIITGNYRLFNLQSLGKIYLVSNYD